MMSNMRTIIDLPEPHLKALNGLCARENISRAEAVRRAVALMLQDAAVTDKDASFGAWKRGKRDSRKLVDALRDEWGGR